MRRLYYLTDDIDRAKHIACELEHHEVADRRIHVLSRNEGGLMTRHLHGASYLDRLDIVHRGLQGLVAGLLGGCLLLGLLMLIMDRMLDPTGQLALVALTTLLGSWVGALVGFTYENRQLGQFHDAVEEGKHLIMVDVPRKHVPRVRGIIDAMHEARFVGENYWLAL